MSFKREDFTVKQYLYAGVKADGLWYISSKEFGNYLHRDGSIGSISIHEVNSNHWFTNKVAAQANLDKWYPEHKREDFTIVDYTENNLPAGNFFIAVVLENAYLYRDGSIQTSCNIRDNYNGWYKTKNEAQAVIDKYYPNKSGVSSMEHPFVGKISEQKAYEMLVTSVHNNQEKKMKTYTRKDFTIDDNGAGWYILIEEDGKQKFLVHSGEIVTWSYSHHKLFNSKSEAEATLNKFLEKNDMEHTKIFCVKVINPTISEMLQKLAFASGHKWGDGKQTVQYTDNEALLFNESYAGVFVRIIKWSDVGSYEKKYNVVSLERAIELLSKPLHPNLTIDGHKVTFNGSKIIVNGVTITKDEAQKFYDQVWGKVVIGGYEVKRTTPTTAAIGCMIVSKAECEAILKAWA